MSTLTQWINLVVFTPGRARYALRQMGDGLDRGAHPRLAAAIEQALAAATALQTVEDRWRTRKSLSTGRGRAAELDAVLDRLLAGLVNQVRLRLDLMAADDPRKKPGEHFLLSRFPGGAGPVTLLPFEDELIVLEELVAWLATPEGARLAAQFELSYFVQRLRSDVPVFAAELGARKVEEISFDDVRAAREHLQHRLSQVVVAALADFGEPEQASALAALLEPLENQQRRLRALRAGRRRVNDVDPGTGEILPLPGESDDPDLGPENPEG